jgi:hypothetical protein
LAESRPTYILAFVFDCTGRPLRGAEVTFRWTNNENQTIERKVPTTGNRSRPAQLLLEKGVGRHPMVEVRAEYQNLKPEKEVLYLNASDPEMCEFTFHLKDNAEEVNWRRYKRHRNRRCRCAAQRDGE